MKPEEVSIFPVGGKNDVPAKYFVGQSYLNMLTTEGVDIIRNGERMHRSFIPVM